MFVSDEDAVNLIEIDFTSCKPRQGFAFTEATIDEEASALRFEQRDIARTAGRQDGDAQTYEVSPKICRTPAKAVTPNKFLR